MKTGLIINAFANSASPLLLPIRLIVVDFQTNYPVMPCTNTYFVIKIYCKKWHTLLVNHNI